MCRLPSDVPHLNLLVTSVLAIILTLSWCSSSQADASLVDGFPGLGWYSFSNSTGDSVSVWAADTDENAKEILTTSDTSFEVDITAAGGLTMEPHDLWGGDWAHAIAVFQTGSIPLSPPLAFFQVRSAGSSAEVIDSTLADAAVSANLWTSADDYFELPPEDAVVSPRGGEQTGPNSFGSAPFPEPTAFTLQLLASCCIPWRRIRRVKCTDQ